MARIYGDPTTHLYFQFLNSILSDVSTVNKLFQNTSADFYKLQESLWSLILATAGRIFKPEFVEEAKKKESLTFIENQMLSNRLALKPVRQVDCGLAFTTAAKQYLETRNPLDRISMFQLDEVKGKCQEYLLVLCEELIQRMPSNMKLIQKSAKFSPLIMLSQVTKPQITELLTDLLPPGTDLKINEEQLRKIDTINWASYPAFTAAVLRDTSNFWSQVYNFTDAENKHQFRELASLALQAQSIPASNAVVERIFSIINAVKNKLRNRMKMQIYVIGRSEDKNSPVFTETMLQLVRSY